MLKIQKNLKTPFYMLLSLPATAMGFALSVQIAALSWIMSAKYGLEVHEVGLVWAGGPIAGILGQVIIGVISDKVWFWGGRRRPFMLIGGVLATLMLFALPNLDVITDKLGIEGILGVAIVTTLFLDLSINVSFNPTRSIIADVTPDGPERTRGYTWMQTVSGTFGVMAYAIGAYFGKEFLIYFGVVLVLVCSLLPPFFIQEPEVISLEEEENNLKQTFSVTQIMLAIRPLWSLLAYNVYILGDKLINGIHVSEAPNHYWPEIIFGLATVYLMADTLLKKEPVDQVDKPSLLGFKKVLAAHSFSWIGVQTMFVYMFAYLDFKFPTLSDDSVGQVIDIAFLVLSAVSALLPAILLEPLSQKFGRVRVHTACLFVMTLGYAGIWGLADSVYAIYFFMAICGVGWAAIISLPFAIMSQRVDGTLMGTFMGLFNLAVVLPQLLSSLAIGVLISSVADKNIIFAIATLSLGLSTIAWTQVKPLGSSTAPSGKTQ
ncbi:MFS transporter [Temperatibacter marinus]|uniref:MFS transporter n=1 Tax=Temperatibacter marinus TaxID=1456591 RepID=A0AA52ECV8_9PROT|nr:MFS transporter [Temperatibacter marinus]WND03107.1 MFS transporter [Temperatibacter marinus]